MFNSKDKDLDLLGSSSDEGARKLLYKEYCTIIPAYHARFLDDNVLVKGNSKEEEEKFVEHLLQDVMKNFPHLSEVTATMIIRKTFRDMPETASSYFLRREEEMTKVNALSMCDTSGDVNVSETAFSDSPGAETTSLPDKDSGTELGIECNGKEKAKLLEGEEAEINVESQKEQYNVDRESKVTELDKERALCEEHCCDLDKGLGVTEPELCALEGACGKQVEYNDDTMAYVCEDKSRKREKELEDFKIQLARTLLDSQVRSRNAMHFYAANEENVGEKSKVGNNFSTAWDNDEQRCLCDECDLSAWEESLISPTLFPSNRKRICKHGHRFRKEARWCLRKATEGVMKRIMCPLQETDEELPMELCPQILVEKNQSDGLIGDVTSDQRKTFLRGNGKEEKCIHEDIRYDGSGKCDESSVACSEFNSTAEGEERCCNYKARDVSKSERRDSAGPFVKEQQYTTDDNSSCPESHEKEPCFAMGPVTPIEFLEGTSVTWKPTPQKFIPEGRKSYEEQPHSDNHAHGHDRPLTPLPMLIKQNSSFTYKKKNDAIWEGNDVEECDVRMHHDSSEGSAMLASYGFLEKTEVSADTKQGKSGSSEVFLLPHEDDAKSLQTNTSEFDVKLQEGRTVDQLKSKKNLNQTANGYPAERPKASVASSRSSLENEISSSCACAEQEQHGKIEDVQNNVEKSIDLEPAEGPKAECHQKERHKQSELQDTQGYPKESLILERLIERTDVSIDDGSANHCGVASCKRAQGYLLTRKQGRTDLRVLYDRDGTDTPHLWHNATGKRNLDHVTSASEIPGTHGVEEQRKQDVPQLCCSHSLTQTAESGCSRNISNFPSFINLSRVSDVSGGDDSCDSTAREVILSSDSMFQTSMNSQSSEVENCFHELQAADKVKCEANAVSSNFKQLVNDGTNSGNRRVFSVPKLKELIELHTQEKYNEDLRSKPGICHPERNYGSMEEAQYSDTLFTKPNMAEEKSTENSRTQDSVRQKVKTTSTKTSAVEDEKEIQSIFGSSEGSYRQQILKKTNRSTDLCLRRAKTEENNVPVDCEVPKPRERLRLLRILEASWPKLSETEIETIVSKAQSPPSSNEDCCGSGCEVQTETLNRNRDDIMLSASEDITTKLDDQYSKVCPFSRADEEYTCISKNLPPCSNSTKSQGSLKMIPRVQNDTSRNVSGDSIRTVTSLPTIDALRTEPEHSATASLPNDEAVHTKFEDSAVVSLSANDALHTGSEDSESATSSLPPSDVCLTDRTDLNLSSAFTNEICSNVQHLESNENVIISVGERGSSPEISAAENVSGTNCISHSSTLSYLRNSQLDSENARKSTQSVSHDEKPGRFLLEAYLQQSNTWNQRRCGIDAWDRNPQSEIFASHTPLSPISSLEDGFLSTDNFIHSTDIFVNEDYTVNSVNISNFSGDQLELIEVSPNSSNSDVSRSEKYPKTDIDCALASQEFNLDTNSRTFQLDGKKFENQDVHDLMAELSHGSQYSQMTVPQMSDLDECKLFGKTTNEVTTDDNTLINEDDSATNNETNVATKNSDGNSDEKVTCIAKGSSGLLMCDVLCQEEKCDEMLSNGAPSVREKDLTVVVHPSRLNEFFKDHDAISSSDVMSALPDDPRSSAKCIEPKSCDYCLEADDTDCSQCFGIAAGDCEECLPSIFSNGKHQCSDERILILKSNHPPVATSAVLQDVTTHLTNPNLDEGQDQNSRFKENLYRQMNAMNIDNSVDNVHESKCCVGDQTALEGNSDGKSCMALSDDIDFMQSEIDQNEDCKCDNKNAAETLGEDVHQKSVIDLAEQPDVETYSAATVCAEKRETEKAPEIDGDEISAIQNEQSLSRNSGPDFQEDFSQIFPEADRGFSPGNLTDDTTISEKRFPVADRNEQFPALDVQNQLPDECTVNNVVNCSVLECGKGEKSGPLNEEKNMSCDNVGKDFAAGDLGSKKLEEEKCALKSLTTVEKGNGESQALLFQREEVTDDLQNLQGEEQSKNYQSEEIAKTSGSHQTHGVSEHKNLHRSADYMALLESVSKSSDTKLPATTKSKSDASDEGHHCKGSSGLMHSSKDSSERFSSRLQKDASLSENEKGCNNKHPAYSKQLQTEDACAQKEERHFSQLKSRDGTPDLTGSPCNQKAQNSRKARDNDCRQNGGSGSAYPQRDYRDRRFSWKSYRNRRIAQKYEEDDARVSFECDNGACASDDRNVKRNFGSNGLHESSWQKRNQRENQSRKPHNCNRMGASQYGTSTRYKTEESDGYCAEYCRKSCDKTLRSDYRSRSREYRNNYSRDDKRSRSKGREYHDSRREYSNMRYNQKTSRSRSRPSLKDKRHEQPPVAKNSSRYPESRTDTKNGKNRNGSGTDYISEASTSKHKGERITKKSAEVGDNGRESSNNGGKIKGAKKSRRRRTLSKKLNFLKSQENVPEKEETKVEEGSKGVNNGSLCTSKTHGCDSKGNVSNHSQNGHEKKKTESSKPRSNKEVLSNDKETTRKSSKSDEVSKKASKMNDSDRKKVKNNDCGGKFLKQSNSHGTQETAAINAGSKVKHPESDIHVSIDPGLQEQLDECFQAKVYPGAPSGKVAASEGDVSMNSEFKQSNENQDTFNNEDAAQPSPELDSSSESVGQSWKPNSFNHYRKYYGQTWTNMRDNWATYGYVNYLKMNYPPALTGWDWRGKMGYTSSRYRGCLYYPPNAHESQNFGNMYFWKAYEEMRYQNVFSGTAQYTFHGNDQPRRVGRRFDSNYQQSRQAGSGSRTSKGWGSPRYSKYPSSRSSECHNWRERRSSRRGDPEAVSLNSGKNLDLSNIQKDVEQSSQELHTYGKNDSTVLGKDRNLQSTEDLNETPGMGQNLCGDNLPSENIVDIRDEEETLIKLEQYCFPESGYREFGSSCREIPDGHHAEPRDLKVNDGEETLGKTETNFLEMPFWEIECDAPQTQNLATGDQASCEVLTKPEDGETAQVETLNSVLEYDANLHSFALERNESFERNSVNDTQWKKQYFWKNVEQPGFEYLERGDQSDKTYLYDHQPEGAKTFPPCFANADYGTCVAPEEKENYTMDFTDNQELPMYDFYQHTSNSLSGAKRNSEYFPVQTSAESPYEKYSLIINIAESDSETEETSAPMFNTNSFSEFDFSDSRLVRETCKSRQDESRQDSGDGTEFVETRMKQRTEVETDAGSARHLCNDSSTSDSNDRNAACLLSAFEDGVKSEMKTEDKGFSENAERAGHVETSITTGKDGNESKPSLKKNDDTVTVELVDGLHRCTLSETVDVFGDDINRCVRESGKSVSTHSVHYSMGVQLHCKVGESRDDLTMEDATEQAMDVLEEKTYEQKNGSSSKPAELQCMTGEDNGYKSMSISCEKSNYSIASERLIYSESVSDCPTADGVTASDGTGKLPNKENSEDIYHSQNATYDSVQGNWKKGEMRTKDAISETLPQNILVNIPNDGWELRSPEKNSEMEKVTEVSNGNPQIDDRVCCLKTAEVKEKESEIRILETGYFNESNTVPENATKDDHSTFVDSNEADICVNLNLSARSREERENFEKRFSTEREETCLFREHSDLRFPLKETNAVPSKDAAPFKEKVLGEQDDGRKKQSDDHLLVNIATTKSTCNMNTVDYSQSDVSSLLQQSSSSSRNDGEDGSNCTKNVFSAGSDYSAQSFGKRLNHKNERDSASSDVCNPLIRANSSSGTDEDTCPMDISERQAIRTEEGNLCEIKRCFEGSKNDEGTGDEGLNGIVVISGAAENSPKSTSEKTSFAEKCSNMSRNYLVTDEGDFTSLTQPQETSYECSTNYKLRSSETCDVNVKEILSDKGKLLPEALLNMVKAGSSTIPSGLFGEISSEEEASERLPKEEIDPKERRST